MMAHKVYVILCVVVMGLMVGCGDQKETEVDIGVGPITALKLSSKLQPKLVSKGQVLFQEKCSVCHKFDQKLIGPPLANVTQRRSPEWIMNMILNPERMIRENPTAMALLKDFDNVEMENQNLSKSEARSVLEYLRHVDSKL